MHVNIQWQTPVLTIFQTPDLDPAPLSPLFVYPLKFFLYPRQAKKALVNLTMEAEVYTGAHMSRVYFEGLGQKDGYKLSKVIELDLTTRREVCNNYKLYIGVSEVLS